MNKKISLVVIKKKGCSFCDEFLKQLTTGGLIKKLMKSGKLESIKIVDITKAQSIMSRKNVPDFETVPQVMAFDRHKKFRGRLQEDKPRDLKHLLELVNQSALTTTLRKVKKSDV